MAEFPLDKDLTPEQQERISPTKWTSTQKGPTYMTKAKELRPANVPGQRIMGRVVNGDGETIESSVPNCYYEKWIDPAGNVRCIPMKTARAMEEQGDEMVFVDSGAYYAEQRAQLLAKGFLHYETGGRSEDTTVWLARRDKVIVERSRRQAATMAKAEDRHMTEGKARDAKIQEALTATFEQLLGNFQRRPAPKGA